MNQICTKKVFSVKNGKSEHHHWILHIQVSIGTKFQLKPTISDKIYPKNVFLVEIRKSEHHHWILHMRIGLGTKFQLRLTILMFWAKFSQKGCFRIKTKNSHPWVCLWLFLTILLNFFEREPTDTTVFVTRQDKGV